MYEVNITMRVTDREHAARMTTMVQYDLMNAMGKVMEGQDEGTAKFERKPDGAGYTIKVKSNQ